MYYVFPLNRITILEEIFIEIMKMGGNHMIRSLYLLLWFALVIVLTFEMS